MSIELKKHFTMDPLKPQEMAVDAPNHNSHLRVLTPLPDGAQDKSLDHITQAKDEVIQLLESHGALLFRNCAIESLEQAEKLVLDLDINMDNQYLGGASPRSSFVKIHVLFNGSALPLYHFPTYGNVLPQIPTESHRVLLHHRT